MPTGQKHLVKCRCILPQYRNVKNPPFHAFVVFSVIDDDDNVIPKFTQCSNCGIIHKVTDLSKSEIVKGKENMSSLRSIDDIRSSISTKIAAVLDANGVDLATWEAVEFILENKKWGEFVVLNSDSGDGTKQGKYIKILGDHDLFKVETYVIDEFV